jgi:hypothetical protein
LPDAGKIAEGASWLIHQPMNLSGKQDRTDEHLLESCTIKL